MDGGDRLEEFSVLGEDVVHMSFVLAKLDGQGVEFFPGSFVASANGGWGEGELVPMVGGVIFCVFGDFCVFMICLV